MQLNRREYIVLKTKTPPNVLKQCTWTVEKFVVYKVSFSVNNGDICFSAVAVERGRGRESENTSKKGDREIEMASENGEQSTFRSVKCDVLVSRITVLSLLLNNGITHVISHKRECKRYTQWTD